MDRRNLAVALLNTLPGSFAMPASIELLDRAGPFVRLGMRHGLEMVYPLFAKPWTFVSPDGGVLSQACKAIVEMLVDADCVADGYLQFTLPDGRKVEITDELSDVWCLMLHTDATDDTRSAGDTDEEPFFDV